MYLCQSHPTASDVKTPQSKVGKPADKEKQITALTVSDTCSLKYAQKHAQYSKQLLIISLFFVQVQSNTSLNEVCLMRNLLLMMALIWTFSFFCHSLVFTLLLQLQVESVGTGRPLLDQSLQYRDGRLFLPGNSTLASLNLTGRWLWWWLIVSNQKNKRVWGII